MVVKDFHQGKVNSRIGNEVVLKFVEVNVEGALESQRGCYRGHCLCDYAVEVGVGGTIDGHVLEADLVNGLVVDQERDVCQLEAGVGRQDGVVGLDDGWGHVGSGVDNEFEF